MVPSIFMKFWSRNNLEELDWLTAQDVYYLAIFCLFCPQSKFENKTKNISWFFVDSKFGKTCDELYPNWRQVSRAASTLLCSIWILRICPWSPFLSYKCKVPLKKLCNWHRTKVRNMCLLFYLRFSFTRETDAKKLSNFGKLQFLNDKSDQNTNFSKC